MKYLLKWQGKAKFIFPVIQDFCMKHPNMTLGELEARGWHA